MIARILSLLFPPRPLGRVRDWEERIDPRPLFEEQGWAGNVRHLRTGIDRHFAEKRGRA
jgi:hypothetical protein